MSKYEELRKINVSEHTEKKNNLTYLSWAWAVDVLLLQDPTATWEYAEPKRFGDTLMVFCTVHAFGKSMTAQLPVMDHRNKAIANPDAFSVNTAMQRCLAKAIALHGLGLYIYAGEDLPEDDDGSAASGRKPEDKKIEPQMTAEQVYADLNKAASKGNTALTAAIKKTKAEYLNLLSNEQKTALREAAALMDEKIAQQA
ncbi:MAG TPA: DUF1071 domain-containing protein [Methylophilaceae bacterium]|nr:DUF1071 domain-containing protein [Methylophilaceae bacterium]HYD35912.1 DUF1071 domain-containing protein [Vitreimonas sp.]